MVRLFRARQKNAKVAGKSLADLGLENPYETMRQRNESSPLRKTRSPLKVRPATVESPEKCESQYYEEIPLANTYLPLSPEIKLRYEEEKTVVTYLKDMMALETAVESDKSNLALKPDFNLIDAFRIFDVEASGMIEVQDLKITLQSLGLFVEDDQLNLLYEKYNVKLDGKLTYSEFCQMFSPKHPEYSAILNSRTSYYVHKPHFRREEYFHPETRKAFVEVFKSLFLAEETAQRERNSVKERPKFNVQDAFLACDIDGNGFIDPHELKVLFENHGFYYTHLEVNTLMERIDKDGDGRISFQDFTEELEPSAEQQK